MTSPDFKPKVGDIFLIVYTDGKPHFEAIHAPPRIISESEIPVIRDAVRSICPICEVAFKLASGGEEDYGMSDKSYLLTLTPCQNHLFRMAKIQRMIDIGLENHLRQTKELKLAPYDPLKTWEYSAPRDRAKSQQAAKDVREAKAMGLSKATQAFLRGKAECPCGKTVPAGKSKYCSAVCRRHFQNQAYYRGQTGVIFGTRSKKDDRHHR